MVHRKSTYKLSFKNINEKIRKSIWEENTVFRERRRNDEMSHHSIDEDYTDCECDTDEAMEDEYINNKRPSPQRQSRKKTRESLLHEDKRTTVNPLKVTAEGIDLKSPFTKDRRNFVQKVHDTPISRNEEEKHSRTEEHVKVADDIKPRHLSDSLSELSLTTTDKAKHKLDNLRGRINKDKRYLSETNLELTREFATLKGNRGVMKFSPLTGEFDLIPSRLGKVARSKNDAAGERPCRRTSSGVRNARNVINIRPRSSVSAFRSTSNQPNEFHGIPHCSMTSSGTDFYHLRRELTSTRKEPRFSAADKAKVLSSSTACICCGQDMKLRGVMT